MIQAILIDSREPRSIQTLSFGNAMTAVTALDCGDLWVTTDDESLLIIERKTPNDLLASIKDGRIFQQCTAMRQFSVWAYVVVTGLLATSANGHVIIDERVTGWRWGDVQGALLTIQELGVGVVYAESEADYEATVLRLARRERSSEKVLMPRQRVRVMSPAEEILISLPGIGLDRAQTLINEFDGKAAHALAWLTWRSAATASIAGISDGTKQAARRALGLSEDEEMDIYTPEEYRKEAAA